MGFGLVIGVIKHLQIVNTSNYIAVVKSHTEIYYSTLLSLLCLQRLSENGFQCRSSLRFCVPY
jgi:hypothetical protein